MNPHKIEEILSITWEDVKDVGDEIGDEDVVPQVEPRVEPPVDFGE